MLRTLQGERAALQIHARRILRPAGIAAAMFLMMRAELLMRASPMAVSMMAAGLAAGHSAAALVAGCLLGMIRIPMAEISLLPAVSCALVLAMELALSFLPRLNRIETETRSAAIAGLAALLPAMVQAGGEPLASARALACGLLAAASAPFLASTLQWKPGSRRMNPPEKMGFILAGCACIAGIYALLPPLAEGLCTLTVLLFPHPASGALSGMALAAGGASLMKTASLALCALATGGKFLQRRWQKSLAICMAAVAARLFAGADALDPRWALCAAAAYPLLPESWLGCMGEWFAAPGRPAIDSERIAREITAETRRRITALGDAFSAMAEGCETAADVPDEQALIQQMRCRLCAGCTGYEACWTGADNRGVHLLCRLIGDALDRVDAPPGMRTLFSDGEIPPDILRNCRRGRMIPDRLGLLLRDFAEKRRSEIKRCATGRLLSLQFSQARQILYNLAEGQTAPLQPARLQAALDCAGLEGCEALAGTNTVHLSRTNPGWTGDEIRRAATVLNRTLGGRFLPRMDGEALCFVRAPRLEAETGASCQSGIAGAMCGDSHLVRMLDDTRLMLVISDGMGMGETAGQESTQALRLLWRFLDAGISRPLALETINQQLLMRSGEDIFATLDLCIIDLNSGVAEFTKLAACRTIILRGRELVRVEGGCLPLGILENVQPSVTRVRLRPGDVLIMGSDGVMEAGDLMLVERIARASAASEPAQLAEALVRESGLNQNTDRRDDRTCICVRIKSA